MRPSPGRSRVRGAGSGAAGGVARDGWGPEIAGPRLGPGVRLRCGGFGAGAGQRAGGGAEASGPGPGAQGRGRGRGRQDRGPRRRAPLAGGSGSRQQRRRHGLLFRPLHAHLPLHFPAGECRPLLGPPQSQRSRGSGRRPPPQAQLAGSAPAWGSSLQGTAGTRGLLRLKFAAAPGGVGSQCPRRDPSGPSGPLCASCCVCTRGGGRNVPSGRDRCWGAAGRGPRGTKAFGRRGAWILLSPAPWVGNSTSPVGAARSGRGAAARAVRACRGRCVWLRVRAQVELASVPAPGPE